MQILILALAPVFLIFAYIYWKDRYEREPIWLLLITFFFGVLISFPIVVLQETLQQLSNCHSESQGLSLAFYYFLVVAFSEEGMKYLIVRIFNYPLQHFNEPFDGIVYCVVVSLGFAALENILYIGAAQNELRVGLMRMVVSVPIHAVCGAAMGYYVGRAKFRPSRFWATKEHIKGVIIAISLHGTFDYLCARNVSFYVLVILVILGVIIVNQGMYGTAQLSPFRRNWQKKWQELTQRKYPTSPQRYILDEDIENTAAATPEDLGENENSTENLV
ncbi:MAG: PrsW family intramembrane metalloprotease [Bacteroidia bacterium]